MAGSKTMQPGPEGKRDTLRGEALALAAMGFAVVALIAISLANLGRTQIVSFDDGEEIPVRVVATSGG